MELQERYQRLSADYTAALNGLERAVKEDIAGFTVEIQDLVRNGRIQKFEICAELAWKAAKLFIEIELGEFITSPKQVYRKLFTANIIHIGLLEGLLETIDDGNQLSHIYKEESFVQVEERLGNHLVFFKKLKSILQ